MRCSPTWKRLTRLLAGGLVLAAVWACNAPFIPVPPPAATTYTAALVTVDGQQKTLWIARGAPLPQAALSRHFILNTNNGQGVITTAGLDGAYVAPPMEGVPGDHIFIYYEDPQGQTSETVCRVLREGPDPAPNCP